MKLSIKKLSLLALFGLIVDTNLYATCSGTTQSITYINNTSNATYRLYIHQKNSGTTTWSTLIEAPKTDDEKYNIVVCSNHMENTLYQYVIAKTITDNNNNTLCQIAAFEPTAFQNGDSFYSTLTLNTGETTTPNGSQTITLDSGKSITFS